MLPSPVSSSLICPPLLALRGGTVRLPVCLRPFVQRWHRSLWQRRSSSCLSRLGASRAWVTSFRSRKWTIIKLSSALLSSPLPYMLLTGSRWVFNHAPKRLWRRVDVGEIALLNQPDKQDRVLKIHAIQQMASIKYLGLIRQLLCLWAIHSLPVNELNGVSSYKSYIASFLI